jgi:hypothetical protein
MMLDVELTMLAISPTFQESRQEQELKRWLSGDLRVLATCVAITSFRPVSFVDSNRMVHFIRTLILVLSTATLSLAASSWSFSDATIAVGPKGKDATSLHTYPFLGN